MSYGNRTLPGSRESGDEASILYGTVYCTEHIGGKKKKILCCCERCHETTWWKLFK